MRIEYTRTALREIDDIFSYIAAENPVAARRVIAMIERVVGRLAAFPQSGVATDMAGVRMTPALPFPYLIFYSIDGDILIVRNVRHAARRREDSDRP